MPYITQAQRPALDAAAEAAAPADAGELNYLITRLADRYLAAGERVSYARINEVIGVLECAKLELYRRVAAPYEDGKAADNGDAYSVVG